MAVRRRADGELAGIKPPRFPYPCGSDLHWLWGWGQRIGANLDCEGFTPSHSDWIFHRADEHAANAMLNFSIDYPAVIEEIRLCQRDVESRWDEVLDHETDESRFGYLDALDVLNRRIWKACELIAERQGTESNPAGTKAAQITKLAGVIIPPEHRTKKIKPRGDTVKVIRLIQAGKSNDEIIEAGKGNTIDNIRQIRSRLERNEYEI